MAFDYQIFEVFERFISNYLVNLFARKETLITFAPAFKAKFIQDLVIFF